MPEKPQPGEDGEDLEKAWKEFSKSLEQGPEPVATGNADAHADTKPATSERAVAGTKREINNTLQGGENWLMDHVVRMPPRPEPRPKPESKPKPKPVPAPESIPKSVTKPTHLKTLIEKGGTEIEIMAEEIDEDDILTILTEENPILSKENAILAEKIATFDFSQITFKAKRKLLSDMLQNSMLPEFCAEVRLCWDHDKETSIFTIARIPGISYDNKIMDEQSRAFVNRLLAYISKELKVDPLEPPPQEPVPPPFVINLSFQIGYGVTVTDPFIDGWIRQK